jgi:hypothetical protein
MRVCYCALPSMYGSQICDNCNNNLEKPNGYQGNYTFTEYPKIFDSSIVYICKKCGNANQELISIVYNEDADWLNLKCKKCGYLWVEDPIEKNKKKEEEEK